MKVVTPRLLLQAVIFAAFSLAQANPQLSKFIGQSYTSNRVLEHGIHSIFQVPHLSETCSRDLKRFAEQIAAIIGHPMGTNQTSVDSWALQMLDSWAKVPEGILSGHVNALGDFDECLGVRATPLQEDSSDAFQGKYCLIYTIPNITSPNTQKISATQNINALLKSGEKSIEKLMKILAITGRAELPIIPTIGTCYPSSCTDEEIFQVVGALFSKLNLIPLTSFCSVDEAKEMSSGAIATLSVIGVLVFCAVVGTGLDLASKHGFLSFSFQKATLTPALLAFSIPTNMTKFLRTETGQNDITCLHGIRFLCATWVVLGHTYLMGIIQPLWNLVDTYTMITNSISFLFIANAMIVVEVFFVMGGFLVTFTLLPMLERSKGKLNIPLLYLSRYLRITPMYMLIVLFGTFVFPLLGSGPYWHISKTWATYCERNWWKNLLYINNLPIYNTLEDPTDSACHGMSWYLGVDMQLFLLSPFLLIPICKWKKYGKAPLIILTLASILVPGIVTYAKDMLPLFVPFRDITNKFSQEAYMPTYMRATPYLIGMCTGLVYDYVRKNAYKLKRYVVVAIWMVAISVGFAVLLSPQKFFNPEYNFEKTESALYVSGQRMAWSLCISWLIFACATGNGGWINDFLSWRPFVPLGRLTFAIYLVSMHVQFLFHLQARQPIYVTHYHMINLYFAHLLMSCLIALGCTLLIEAPLMQLLKLVLPSRTKTTDVSKNNNNDEAMFKQGRSSLSPDPSIGSNSTTTTTIPSGYGSTNILANSNQELIYKL